MKLFDTSTDIVELIDRKFEDCGLAVFGLDLKVMSTTKSKDVIKVSKASATTEYLTKKEGMITLVVYEEAFDRLPDDAKEKLVEMALSDISYDSEKDRVMIDGSPYNKIFRFRKKYGDEDLLNVLELVAHILTEIEEEAKAKKEAAREAKKNKQQ